MENRKFKRALVANRGEIQIQKESVWFWKYKSKDDEINKCIEYDIDDAYRAYNTVGRESRQEITGHKDDREKQIA